MKYAILAILVCANITNAADDEASKKLLADLQGTYKVTGLLRSGDPPNKEFFDSLEKVVIKGNKFTITFKDGNKTEDKTATISIDASKKTPEIDMKPDDGPNKEMLGIVLYQGEVVRLCWSDTPKAARPTRFESTKDDKQFLITLTRVK